MTGFRVSVNSKEVAAVSTDDLNILSVQIHGDVIGDELAELQVFGGNYNGEETDTHLIWIDGFELHENDEVEVILHESIKSSCRGKTIDELHPETEVLPKENQTIDELFKDLSDKPKKRDGFSIKLHPSSGEPVIYKTSTDDFSFIFSVMWKWLHPEKASVWLTSNTLEGIKERKSGTNHARLSLQYEQGIKLNVGT